MVRQTHGHYDATTGLPDNTMQPTGAGYNVWLNEQIVRLYGVSEGQKLIDKSVKQGERRYAWLLEQLDAEVVEEYHKWRRQVAANRRYREKENHLRHLEERFASTKNEKEKAYFQKEIGKAKKYLESRKKV